MADDWQEERAKKALEGRRIEQVQVVRIGSSAVLRLKLDDGKFVTLLEEGGVGADSGWYTWPVVKVDGKEIFRG